MSEATELSAHELKLKVDGISADWFLQELVGLANTGAIDIPITLYVQGCIISGRLVGGKKYFASIGTLFFEGLTGSDGFREEMRNAFTGKGAIYDNPETCGPAQFIHVLDAQCVGHYGQTIPCHKGVAWRGRVNAVSGFSLGILTTKQQDEPHEA